MWMPDADPLCPDVQSLTRASELMAGKVTKPPAEKKVAKPKAATSIVEKPLSKALGPVAEDFGKEIRPLGREVGELTVRTVRSLLIKPVAGMVNGIEYCGEWISSRVAERLESIPKENIVEPDVRVSWPALQAFVYTGEDATIREMFVNLLSSDMNSETKSNVHPAFVEMIKQMTGFEARVLKVIYPLSGSIMMEHRRFLAGGQGFNTIERKFSFDVEGSTSIEIEVACNNLSRLGLLFQTDAKHPADKALQKMKDDYLSEVNEKIPPDMDGSNDISLEGIYITALGRRFAQVCLT